MDFLKELFSAGPLTYDQLAAAAKSKGYQVVNAADGAYAPKADVDHLQGQITTLTGQLADTNKKLEGYDPAWKDKAETERKRLEAQQFDFALERAISATKPRNAKAVAALLDREKLSFAGGEIIGLDKQLDSLKKGEDTAFLFEPENKLASGMSHQNARSVGESDTTKEAANQALRDLFGRSE